MPTAHRIRRLRWRVRAESRDAAFDLRARLRRQQAELLEVFERAFEAAGVGDAIVHVPRLDVAITLPDIDGIGAALAQALARREGWATPAGAARPGPFDDRRPRPPTERAPAGRDGLLDYLRSGVLPWPLANLGRTDTHDQLASLALAHRDRVAADLPVFLDAALAYVFRWLQLTPPAEWTAIAMLVGAQPPAADLLASVSALAASAGSSQGPNGAAPEAVAAAMLAVVHLDWQSAPIGERQLSELFAPIVPISRSATREAFLVKPSLLPDPVAKWITARLGGAASEPPAIRPVRLTGALPAAEPAGASPGAPPEVSAEDPTPDDDRPGSIVDHAGLIVIHPFLPRLFERVGVAPKGARSLEPEALPRAAALLAYAALGDDQPLDFELGLIKVLLGLRPEAVVLTPAGTLSAADRGEVDSLLGSVIEHWQVLRHTSITGLRQSFLQRRGLLRAIDGGWSLQVEPESIDILLDRLPWALGPVKLPWMTTLLFTEWARN